MAYVFAREGVLYIGWLGVDGPDKESFRLKDTQANRKRAQQKADQLEQDAADVRRGLKRRTRSDVTFREGAALLLATLPADYASKRDLEARLRLRVFPHLGDAMCRSIVPADVQRTVNAATPGALSATDIRPTRTKRLSAREIREAQERALARFVPNAQRSTGLREQVRIAIQQVFTHLITKEKIVEGDNPAAAVPRVKTPKRVKRWLPWRFVPRLLEAVPEHHRPVFRFCVGTGLRKGEALALRWPDLLIDGESLPEGWADLLVQDELEGAEDMPQGGFVFVSKSHQSDRTKGKKDRVVPLPAWLADELRLARRFSSSSFVFPALNGAQQKKWVPLHEIMRTALKDAALVTGFEARCVNRGQKLKSCGFREVRPTEMPGLKCPGCGQLSLHVEPIPYPLTFRHLRSSYAIHMLRTGGSIKSVADALGNTEAVAAAHYAGLLPQDLLRMANRLHLSTGSPAGVGDAKSGQIEGGTDKDRN